MLTLDFQINWLIDDGGFGPGTKASANFPLILGTVSTDGWVRLDYEATFTGSSSTGGILGGELSGSYYNDTLGDFSTSLFESHTNDNGVTGEGEILLTGFIEFKAFDGDLESDAFSEIYLGKAGGMVTPIPGAVWLLGSGLLGLVVYRRKNLKLKP